MTIFLHNKYNTSFHTKIVNQNKTKPTGATEHWMKKKQGSKQKNRHQGEQHEWKTGYPSNVCCKSNWVESKPARPATSKSYEYGEPSTYIVHVFNASFNFIVSPSSYWSASSSYSFFVFHILRVGAVYFCIAPIADGGEYNKIQTGGMHSWLLYIRETHCQTRRRQSTTTQTTVQSIHAISHHHLFCWYRLMNVFRLYIVYNSIQYIYVIVKT